MLSIIGALQPNWEHLMNSHDFLLQFLFGSVLRNGSRSEKRWHLAPRTSASLEPKGCCDINRRWQIKNNACCIDFKFTYKSLHFRLIGYPNFHNGLGIAASASFVTALPDLMASITGCFQRRSNRSQSTGRLRLRSLVRMNVMASP